MADGAGGSFGCWEIFDEWRKLNKSSGILWVLGVFLYHESASLTSNHIQP